MLNFYKQYDRLTPLKIEALPKKAASKGAKAIIVDYSEKTQDNTIIYNQDFGLYGGTTTQKSMMAVDIRILE